MTHPNVERVVASAAARGLEVEVREFPEGTRTAAEADEAIGVDVGQIVKSLVFGHDDDVVLALVSGENQLDESALSALAGGGAVRRVDADRVRAATGFPIGGVPPFGHVEPLATFIDDDLLTFDVVWAAAGTWNHVFAVAPDELVRVTGGRVADLATSGSR
jgi:prolyl-tRNA editing enzyme YbaK/EbsC (Cys-tRNA(Pro) deacylase)